MKSKARLEFFLSILVDEGSPDQKKNHVLFIYPLSWKEKQKLIYFFPDQLLIFLTSKIPNFISWPWQPWTLDILPCHLQVRAVQKLSSGMGGGRQIFQTTPPPRQCWETTPPPDKGFWETTPHPRTNFYKHNRGGLWLPLPPDNWWGKATTPPGQLLRQTTPPNGQIWTASHPPQGQFLEQP